MVLVSGFAVSTGVGLIVYAVFESTAGALGAFIPLFVLTALVGGLLVRGGRALYSNGTLRERETEDEALFALARVRGGFLRVTEVATALSIPPLRAEALLTRLAKESPDRVHLDVTEGGELVFSFSSYELSSAPPRTRVANEEPEEAVSNQDYRRTRT